MFKLSNWFRLLVGTQVFKKPQTISCFSGTPVRTFADKPDANSKQVALRGTENEEQVRVRRARPSDVPRVLRFVREHALSAWPGLAAPPASPQLMLSDYVERALAQGHSMLAEQQEQRRGWGRIRGLALCVVVCPWDASLLEKWSRCVRCASSRRLMAFTAHCLRAPGLHEKYQAHKVLQVILIVPQENNPKSTEIVNMLAKNAIKRGTDVGFPLIRFDVTSDNMAKILEELNLKKEWQLSYDVIHEHLKETDNLNNGIKTSNTMKAEDTSKTETKTHDLSKAGKQEYSSNDVHSPTTNNEKVKSDETPKPPTFKHRVSVYTALTHADNK